MDWTERSQANLSAATICLEAGHLLAAVNRCYYAVYHRSLAILEDRGPAPPEEQEGHPYWPHSKVAIAMADAMGDDNVAADIRFLLGQRVRADYRQDDITPSTARQVHQVAEDLLRSLAS